MKAPFIVFLISLVREVYGPVHLTNCGIKPNPDLQSTLLLARNSHFFLPLRLCDNKLSICLNRSYYRTKSTPRGKNTDGNTSSPPEQIKAGASDNCCSAEELGQTSNRPSVSSYVGSSLLASSPCSPPPFWMGEVMQEHKTLPSLPCGFCQWDSQEPKIQSFVCRHPRLNGSEVGDPVRFQAPSGCSTSQMQY